MTPVDDLKVGQYVAIFNEKEPEFIPEGFAVFSRESAVTGEPLLIKAISLPFMAVMDTSGSMVPVDLRQYSVKRLKYTYVKAFESLMQYPDDEDGEEVVLEDEPRKRICCPVCTERMVECRDKHGWKFSCRNCKAEMRTK